MIIAAIASKLDLLLMIPQPPKLDPTMAPTIHPTLFSYIPTIFLFDPNPNRFQQALGIYVPNLLEFLWVVNG
jgi:hypothetical protein